LAYIPKEDNRIGGWRETDQLAAGMKLIFGLATWVWRYPLCLAKRIKIKKHLGGGINWPFQCTDQEG